MSGAWSHDWSPTAFGNDGAVGPNVEETMQKKIGPDLTRVVILSVGLDKHLTLSADAGVEDRERMRELVDIIARANLVLDVSGLQNPHYVPELRPLTGRDEPVRSFLAKDEEVRALVGHVKGVLDAVMPGYILRGNNHGVVTLVFRCTGGKHRSQFFAEMAGEHMRELLSRLGSEAVVEVRHVLSGDPIS